MKAIIFDASTLITLAMNGLLEEFSKLKKAFNGKFLITEDVRKEVVDKPSSINRFKLEALRLNKLITDKVLEMPEAVGVKADEIYKVTREIMNLANNTFIAEREIRLVDLGESSCLALSKILTEKKIQNVVAIDERTARMICEKPENLQQLMEEKLHTKLKVRKENYKFFEGFRVIRSAELAYMAYKKGIIGLNDGILEALLYAVKYNGCSISENEIREMLRMK